MIETLTGFPDSVLAVRASGSVTKADYETVLIPTAKAALERHAKLRVYYEIATGFAGFAPGAMWEDFTFGMGHLTQWERVAVVTDVDWIRHATQTFAFLMPCQVNVFSLEKAQEARTWISS